MTECFASSINISAVVNRIPFSIPKELKAEFTNRTLTTPVQIPFSNIVEYCGTRHSSFKLHSLLIHYRIPSFKKIPLNRSCNNKV